MSCYHCSFPEWLGAGHPQGQRAGRRAGWPAHACTLVPRCERPRHTQSTGHCRFQAVSHRPTAARSSPPTSQTVLVQDSPCEQSQGLNSDPSVTPPDAVAHPSPTTTDTHTHTQTAERERSLPAALPYLDPPTIPLHVGSHALTAAAPRWRLCGHAHGQEVAAVTTSPQGWSHSTPRATTPPHALREQRQQGPSAPLLSRYFLGPHSCRERGKPRRPLPLPLHSYCVREQPGRERKFQHSTSGGDKCADQRSRHNPPVACYVSSGPY